MYARTGNSVSVPRFLKTIWIDSPDLELAPIPSKFRDLGDTLHNLRTLLAEVWGIFEWEIRR